TWAWREPSVEVHDPYVITRIKRDGGTYPQPADGARALWRDLDALLGEPAVQREAQRPDVLTALSVGFPRAVLPVGRLQAFGFDQDGQAKDHQWFSGSTPPVLRFLYEVDPPSLARISALREAAEAVADTLRYALRQAWHEATNTDDKKDKDRPWVRK